MLNGATRTIRERWLEPIFYAFIAHAMATVLYLFARWEVSGAEHVPEAGALIVVANHLSLADPPLLSASIPRRLRFMAKQELFDARVGGFFVGLFGAFPVRRFEADLRALRTARRLLQSGAGLGMFPEGHRSHGEGLLRAHPGTALLALRSGAAILPIAITGSEQIRSARVLLQRPRITVSIGRPFTLPPQDRADIEALEGASDRIMRAIAELLPVSYRGVYT